MAFQTSYSQYPAAGAAGMIADDRTTDIESKAAEGAITFGAPVVKGTDGEKQVKMGSGTFQGVAVRTSAVANATDGTSDAGYADEDSVNVGRKGVFWVPLLENVADEGAVTRSVAMSGATAGKWGTATGTAVPNGIWRGAGTSGGLGKLELVLPAVVS